MAVLLLQDSTCQACAVCVEALCWSAFPPTSMWVVTGTVWYCLNSLIAFASCVKIRWTPNPFRVFAFAGVASTLYFVSLGPVALIAFLVLAVYGWIQVFHDPDLRTAGFRFKALMHGTAVAAIMVLVFSAAFAYLQYRRMDDSDIMLRWSGTPVDQAAFLRLKSRGSDGLPNLRQVLKKTGPYAPPSLVRYMAENGEPAKDIPILLEAAQYWETQSGETLLSGFKEAAVQLGAIDAPATAPVAQIRAAWERKTWRK